MGCIERMRGFFDLLWPRFCVGCGRFGGYLCLKCRGVLVQSVRVRCSDVVAGCNGVITVCAPTPLLRAVIHQFKYGYSTELGSVLSELVVAGLRKVDFGAGVRAAGEVGALGYVGAPTAADFDASFGASFAVVPVPLHAARERERGFNQSMTLGRAAGEALSIVSVRLPAAARVVTATAVLTVAAASVPAGPSASVPVRSLLVRIRATSPQARLSRAERLINVHDAFRYITDFAPVPYAVLLIDDVITTGATVSACAAALRLAGVARVYALALARGL